MRIFASVMFYFWLGSLSLLGRLWSVSILCSPLSKILPSIYCRCFENTHHSLIDTRTHIILAAFFILLSSLWSISTLSNNR